MSRIGPTQSPRSATLPTPEPKPVKHPGLPEGSPTYSPWEKSMGEASNLMVSGGDNKWSPRSRGSRSSSRRLFAGEPRPLTDCHTGPEGG